MSLELLIAGATGISSGAAHTIGNLLFKEVGGYGLTELRRLRVCKSGKFGGVRCIGVVGQHGYAGRVVAHFGARDLLLRKLVFGSEEAELRTRVSTRRIQVRAGPDVET